ncbi:Fic family protein [Kocuria rhizophila]|uniref:Fic/DOC family protein n=1 Tax=Kocuria TaxID=57493 RepID=UPI00214F7A34|nr:MULTISPECIES: Fic family protein [Kocuria]MCR4527032.1 Fic family protein [Kocuria rhizophila]MCT1545323.1 Fic family protein [Kocuria rhizophila]MCT2171115.1 Fic family protein [Kocuria rhizophila]MDN3463038.1 Fic family protein [Kocuria sp. APC 4018]
MGEFVDPYLYPGTEVLKNIPGIHDPLAASRFERRETLVRRRELERAPVRGGFDLAHLREIHRRLYQDVWEWAGQIRTVNLTKGSSTFLHPSRIEMAFAGIHEMLRESGLLNDPSISDEDFIEQSSNLLEQINYVHPFREGNGRTQRAYLDQIAALSGRTLSWRNIGRIENERASIRAFNEGTGAPFKPLIEEILKPPLDGLSLLDEELYRASNPDGG